VLKTSSEQDADAMQAARVADETDAGMVFVDKKLIRRLP
jgi:hypothetical protein